MNSHPVLVLLSAALLTACSTPAEKAAGALAGRIVPGYAAHIRFVETADTTDAFTVRTQGRRLVIEGNNAVSMAAGLNWYLQERCGVSVSWYASDPVQVPDGMPAVEEPVRIRARVPQRFFLNYCTFGYTMPWWQWEDWERLIDWMALQGVNLPLAITGQEAVWQEVWRRHGMTDEEIRSFFTGPAHLPWQRMCNIDAYEGPLPQGWIDGQAALQERILRRERSLGMTPVLPAFAGHVPARLKELHPEAQITDIARWAGFPPENLCHFLAPMDSLYGVIQREYLTAQTRRWGTDHIYGFDLFNEVDAPSWDPETLARIARDAYGSVAAVDPEAVWLQMGWMFHYDRQHWTEENVAAYLGAVPEGRVMLLDYYMEHTPVWTRTDGFAGQPWILCYLGNFGGNTRLSGPFRRVAERIREAFRDGGPGLAGLGCTLEGFGVNRFLYEYVLGQAWEGGDDDAWLDALSTRELGREDPAAARLWRDLVDSVYVHGSISEGPLICGSPSLEGWKHWTVIHDRYYPEETLIRIWKGFLGLDSGQASHRALCVNLGCQVLGNRFATLRDAFTAAYRSGDIETLERIGARMKQLMEDCDRLAACEPQFRLTRWLDQASAWGTDDGEAAYYRHDARRLLTTWGPRSASLMDYASRLWSGLISTYYAPRWTAFIDEVADCARTGTAFDPEAFDARMKDFAYAWVEDDTPRTDPPAVDWRTFCETLIERYAL